VRIYAEALFSLDAKCNSKYSDESSKLMATARRENQIAQNLLYLLALDFQRQTFASYTSQVNMSSIASHADQRTFHEELIQ
jgi:hypothetical protein